MKKILTLIMMFSCAVVLMAQENIDLSAQIAALQEQINALQEQVESIKKDSTAKEVEKPKQKVKFKFYGRVRGDLSYNTRASKESVDGLFYMFPLDEKFDTKGNDLNAYPAGNFYMLYTRLGVDMSGVNVGKAAMDAKIEIDFRGGGTNYALVRVRQAYMRFNWPEHDLLVGQTWHPLTGDVTPTMLNLSTGAPFQPFSRTPMVHYRYKANFGLNVTAAAMWQMQYNSVGVDNKKSIVPLKYSLVPEFYLGLEYKGHGFIAGVGGEYLSLTPRVESTFEGNTYKVNERINSFSAEAHIKYTAEMWSIAAKGIYGQNLAHASMLGGYAISSVNQTTGEQKYTPYQHVSAWLNFVYGKKWQPALFVGYTKNLGTTKDIVADKFGTGLDIDQLLSINATMSYNLPHWKIGVEFEPSLAWYGAGEGDKRGRITPRLDDKGRMTPIVNYRVLGVVMFIF